MVLRTQCGELRQHNRRRITLVIQPKPSTRLIHSNHLLLNNSATRAEHLRCSRIPCSTQACKGSLTGTRLRDKECILPSKPLDSSCPRIRAPHLLSHRRGPILQPQPVVIGGPSNGFPGSNDDLDSMKPSVHMAIYISCQVFLGFSLFQHCSSSAGHRGVEEGRAISYPTIF